MEDEKGRITILRIPGYESSFIITGEITRENGLYYASVQEIDPFLLGEGTTPESAQRRLEKSISDKINYLKQAETAGELTPAKTTLLSKLTRRFEPVKTINKRSQAQI